VLLTTTPTVEGKTIRRYHGLVTGEALVDGASLYQHLLYPKNPGLSSAFKKELQKARESALKEMEEGSRGQGANVVLGIDIDYKAVGDGGGI
jgi:uncharacterized protein YbjQ (UPF0145 family)